jgi:hypothetical protein
MAEDLEARQGRYANAEGGQSRQRAEPRMVSATACKNGVLNAHVRKRYGVFGYGRANGGQEAVTMRVWVGVVFGMTQISTELE